MNRGKCYWADPISTPSTSTSSLSSPNETCYSFFRKVLQKLAGGKRGSRHWFIENWHNGGKSRGQYEREGNGDMGDMLIELRRLEDPVMMLSNQSETLSMKSKSVGNILEFQRLDLVRSRSSIPGFSSTATSELNLDGDSMISLMSNSKPRLVKQKNHFTDGDDFDIIDKATDQVVGGFSDSEKSRTINMERGNMTQRQSSMNQEFMSIKRIAEKERLCRNIAKQSSLNDDLIYDKRTYGVFRESFYPGNASRRFQLLKSGLTNRIRQSTTNIERVSGISIKNGFVKILQSWKLTENEAPIIPNFESSSSNIKPTGNFQNLINLNKNSEHIDRRRLSREEGSDSSKDSSLQSDTSVDSEDSFASVIYVPKSNEKTSSLDAKPPSPGHQLSTASSTPPSPRFKYVSDLSNQRLKIITVSPLSEQFPAMSESLPPSSPPGSSPGNLNPAPMRRFFDHHEKAEDYNRLQFNCPKEESISILNNETAWAQTSRIDMVIETEIQDEPITLENSNTGSRIDTNSETEKRIDDSPHSYSKLKESREHLLEETSSNDRLSQIKDISCRKQEFATRSKPFFPLVRSTSSVTPGRLENATKLLPRLLSLELFNPETDDLDSDSSGISSPESDQSVISVISDERYIAKMSQKSDSQKQETSETGAEFQDSDSSKQQIADHSVSNLLFTPQSKEFPEVSVNVTDCLESAINEDSEETSSTKIKRSSTSFAKSEIPLLDSPEDVTWSEDYSQNVIDSTEKFSENLIHDIDQYCQKTKLEISRDFEEMQYTRKSEFSAIYENESKLPHDSSKEDDYIELDNKPGSLEGDEFIIISKNDELIESKTERKPPDNIELRHKEFGEKYLRFGNSIESSDIGDSIENTISESSQGSTRRLGSVSSTSLESGNLDFSRCINDRRRFMSENRSASEEIPSKVFSRTSYSERSKMSKTDSNGTFSCSSSQESLPSDQVGGAITYHQYYHVFREGELDQLINKYVENLHIISSNYDHASWCIVAEKVQVWTI